MKTINIFLCLFLLLSVSTSLFSQEKIEPEEIKQKLNTLQNGVNEIDLNSEEGKQFFIDAISYNLPNTVTSLIQKGIDVNFTIPGPEGEENWTPVAYACYYGNSKIVEILIEADAKIDMAFSFDKVKYVKRKNIYTLNLYGIVLDQMKINMLKLAIENIDAQKMKFIRHINMYEPSNTQKAEILKHIDVDNKLLTDISMINNDVLANLVSKSLDNLKPVFTKFLSQSYYQKYNALESSAKIDSTYEGYKKFVNARNKVYLTVFPILSKQRQWFFDIPRPNFEEFYIYMSAEQNYHNTFNTLINKGLNINIIDSLHETPIIKAAKFDAFDIVKLLVENGAEVNREDVSSYREDALMVAINNGNIEITEYLIKNGSKINYKNTYSPLFLATEKADTNTIKILVKHGADINQIWETPSGRNYTILDYAANQRHKKEFLNFLINNGVNSQSNDWYIFYLSKKSSTSHLSIEEKLDIIALLIDNGMNTDNILITACSNYIHYSGGYRNYTIQIIDDIRIPELLINKGINLNNKDEEGNTALLKAIASGKKDYVKLLIENGADVNIASNNGNTAILETTNYHSTKEERIINGIEILDMLLKAGADVNVADNNGISVLHESLLKSKNTEGSIDFNKKLIEAGAEWKDLIIELSKNPNSDNSRCVSALLKTGIDLDEKHESGKNLQSVAIKACKDSNASKDDKKKMIDILKSDY